MSVKPLTTVPYNNDLLAENYLDDGKKLWLLDHEYSGNHDTTFECWGRAVEKMDSLEFAQWLMDVRG
jgi:thiamine kinase-like enzyme